MRLSFNYNGRFFGADLPSSMTLADLAAYIEAETNLPPTHQTLVHKYNQLSPSVHTTLEQSNIVEDDLIVIQQFDPIANNLNLAYEENPEFFVDVTMLYIKIKINGKELPAFIDTGAQRSLISPDLCNYCDLNHLIDERFKMQARGVGEKQSNGRIHSIPIHIGKESCATSLTVLEIGDVGVLIGLDWMKRFRVKLDLEKNGILIDNTFVQFLDEWEVKKLKAECGIKSFESLLPLEPPQIPKPALAPKVQPTTERLSVPKNSTKFTPEQQRKIETLTGLGFDKQSSITALEQCSWNVELAAGMLF